VYEVSIQNHFSAAHHLREYDGACEAPHGHNWDVEVFVRGRELDDTGLLVDFKLLKQATAAALDELDHTDLNTLEEFRAQNPSSENIARYLHGRLSETFNCDRFRIHRVIVEETRGARASYWDD